MREPCALERIRSALRRSRAPAAIALLGTACAGGRESSAPPEREAVVGLPCEGCEAVFDGLPSAPEWRGRIAPPDEPGEPLVLEGTVTDAEGRPAPGVIVYAYHTDARGQYPPGGPALGEAARRHGRLRGWVATDRHGRYRFDTIRPGCYPDGATPAHVHLHVIEVGRCTYFVDSVHFADDPRLSPAERRELAAGGRGGRGLAHPRRDEEGRWVVTRDVRLGENVPGYPGGPGGGRRHAGDMPQVAASHH